MKGTTFAVLMALLVFAFGISDADAGGPKKRESVPTVLAPALPPTPAVAPPPRVETAPPPVMVVETVTPPTTPSARKCEVMHSTVTRPSHFVAVESLGFATCDGRYHSIPGVTVHTPASQLSSTGIYCR